MNSTIKFMCFGRLEDGRDTRWGGHADNVVVRADGALAIKAGDARMGFRPGGWKRRERTGDYDVYDVDFSQRFSPRKFA